MYNDSRRVEVQTVNCTMHTTEKARLLSFVLVLTVTADLVEDDLSRLLA